MSESPTQRLFGGPPDGAVDLTAGQFRAVGSDAARLVVRGGPGSGRTTILLARVARLVADGVPPEAIAVLVPAGARAEAFASELRGRLPAVDEESLVLTPTALAVRALRSAAGSRPAWEPTLLGPGERLALLLEHLDEIPLDHHDIGGRTTALLNALVRRIDSLQAHCVDVDAFARWADGLADDDPAAGREREFAAIYRAHEQLLARAGARGDGGLLRDALTAARRHPAAARGGLRHLLVDDANELDAAAAALVRALDAPGLTVVESLPGPGSESSATATGDEEVVELPGSHRCPPRIRRAIAVALGEAGRPIGEDADRGLVERWRCADERSEAQAVAADIERLVAREGVAPGAVLVVVPEVTRAGQAVALALRERGVPERVVGDAVFFQRAEIRDALAWLRLLADPTDAPAVVRALARPPVALRSVDIARVTQIARRRKVDMVGACAAALESPQVPPEARDRIRTFLGLYRASTSALDSGRPDLYVHRLLDRLGLRRQQLFAAHPDVVERLRALAELSDLAAAHVVRAPQSTPREFARSLAALAEVGVGRPEPPDPHPDRVQILVAEAAAGLQADHVYVLGDPARRPRETAADVPVGLRPRHRTDDGDPHARRRAEVALAAGRAARRLVLSEPLADDHGASQAPDPVLDAISGALHVAAEERSESLFGPGESLLETYRLLREELLEGTTRAAGRLSELRFDTDLDVSHAVVRYLELLKVAALLSDAERSDPPAVADALRDINGRIGQAVTAEQREILETSPLDDYLRAAERDARARAQALVARDEPSLAAFLPLRGEGVVLSATDIDTYRACPLRYKFARVFRIPAEPTLHQRFGILVHQVLERYHAAPAPTPTLPELLGLLDSGWRRGGFGDTQAERQLRGKATASLTRYHERFRDDTAEPVWFERQFSFTLGPHVLRGRVDRVDRLPDGAYELIDYKTGRPKSAAALADDVQLSLYAVGARESWQLDASRQAYYYLLDDEKVQVPDDGDRAEWVREVATEVAEGIRGQGFEPTPSLTACGVCDYRFICPAAER